MLTDTEETPLFSSDRLGTSFSYDLPVANGTYQVRIYHDNKRKCQAMSKLKKIELAEMLTELRAQLLKARDEGADKTLKFEIADVEIEVQIATTKEAEGKGGVKFWVYNAEAGVAASEGTTQRLKLKLRPTGPDGKPVYVSDNDRLPK